MRPDEASGQGTDEALGQVRALGPAILRRLRVFGTLAMVGAAAAVVALLLAQSAGAIHLGILGPAA
jgi:hypothetical protein